MDYIMLSIILTELVSLIAELLLILGYMNAAY